MTDDTKPDTPAEPTYPRIERQGLDLAEYTRKYVLPEAAQACEDGQLREKMQERDAKPHERNVFWMVEVSPGVYETTSPLPYGLPPIRVQGDPMRAHWQYRMMLHRFRVVGRGPNAWEKARKMSTEVSFMVAGKG